MPQCVAITPWAWARGPPIREKSYMLADMSVGGRARLPAAGPSRRCPGMDAPHGPESLRGQERARHGPTVTAIRQFVPLWGQPSNPAPGRLSDVSELLFHLREYARRERHAYVTPDSPPLGTKRL